MSAELDMTREKGMAYVGQRPWHGMGSALERGAPLEQWRTAAGLDWDLLRSPVRFEVEAGSHGGQSAFVNAGALREMSGRHVLYRSDNHKALSVVSSHYEAVQPGEVLEFFREWLGAGGLEMETAGGLAEGRKIWALARLGDDVVLPGNDRVEGYLLLATSCDGTLATTAKYTTVRVVCQNTLHAADKDGGQPTVRVPHSTKFDSVKVQQSLGLRAASVWGTFGNIAAQLAGRSVTQHEAQRWLVETFGDPASDLADQPVAQAKLMKKVWESVIDSPGSGLPSANGTAWGLLQGATHYMDHRRRYRSDNNRLDSSWFGDAAATKHKALRNAMKLAE